MDNNQFLRSEMLWGPEGQRRLAESHVILFGLGGVGSYTAESPCNLDSSLCFI